MIDNVRNSATFSDESKKEESLLTENSEVDEEFCRFALHLFSKWPPLRAYDRRYLDWSTNPENYTLPENREENPEKYDKVFDMFQKFPEVPMISKEDLKRIGPIRPVNPLYHRCRGHVFPFLDVGPPNISVHCFDMKSISEEIMVPQAGTRENEIIAALKQRLLVLERGKGRAEFEERGKLFAEVLLKSEKMKNISRMLTGEKFSAHEIVLRLESCDVGGSSTEKRERRPRVRYDPWKMWMEIMVILVGFSRFICDNWKLWFIVNVNNAVWIEYDVIFYFQ